MMAAPILIGLMHMSVQARILWRWEGEKHWERGWTQVSTLSLGSCFHSNHGGGGRHTDPEIRRGEGRFQKFLSTLWASVWSKNKEGALAGLCRITLYRVIRCIALCVLHIVGFSVPSIILADLLGNTRLLKGHGLWFVIGGFRSVLFVSCFEVRCFVIVLFRAIIDYRLVNFGSQIFIVFPILVTCKNKSMFASFLRQKIY